MSYDNTVVPLKGIRALVASKMVSSLQQAAQLTHHATCDATALLARKQDLTAQGAKVSIEDLIMEVVVQVLPRHPHINGTLVDKEIHLSKPVHLGVAIALPGNVLIAPAIFDADAMDVTSLREARRDLASRAIKNKVTPKEMTGGTFTISNLGLSRVEHFTPILNAPQLGLLGVGRLFERGVRGSNDTVEWRQFMGLSLTFDHRAIDGAPAASVLTDICETIEGKAA